MLLFSKIIQALLLPLGFSLLCMVAGLVFRRRLLVGYGILLLWMFSMPQVGDALMQLVEGRAGRVPVTAVKSADAVVVLSGMIHQVDGAPLGEWGEAADRFDGGIDIFMAGKAPVIVFTRGQIPWEPDSRPEGELLAKRAMQLGVSASSIRLTQSAGNTADESVAVGKLLGAEPNHRKRIILVTSAYHMQRAVLLFEQAGFEVVPFRVDYQVSRSAGLTVLRILPNENALVKSVTALREILGWLFYWSRSVLPG